MSRSDETWVERLHREAQERREDDNRRRAEERRRDAEHRARQAAVHIMTRRP